MFRINLYAIAALAVLAGCSSGEGAPNTVRTVSVPGFQTRSEIQAGVGPHSDVAAADFDNDGWTDLAVVGIAGDLHIMLGNNSVFTVGQTLSLGGVPVWIESGDLDGDLDLDLAVVRTEGDSVMVLFNDGNGHFEAGPDLLVGSDPLEVLLADANHDHALDLVVSRPSAPEIQVFLNDGTGDFMSGSSLTMPGGGSPFTMTIGDVTRDGLADLIISDPLMDRLLIYEGNQLATDFGPVPIVLPVPGAPKACSLGDLNGDGLTDMAVSAFEANEFVVITDFSGPPGGPMALTSFSLPVDGPPGMSLIGDVTGDELPDLIACQLGRAAVVVVPQLPGGGLGEAFHLEATGIPLRPILADVDNNGEQDLLVMASLHSRINLWRADGNGELVGARSYDTGLQSASYVVTNDLNNDGVLEIVVGDPSGTELSIMRELNGELVVASTIELGSEIFNVRMTDLDRDGRMDLLVPVISGIKVLRNRSVRDAVQFEVLPGTGLMDAFGAGPGPFGVAAADLNRDGLEDLVVSDFASGALQVMLSDSEPFDFAAPTVLVVGGGLVDVAAADFTGDGIVDVAVSRAGKADIVLFENDGLGNLRNLVSVPTGQSPNYLLTQDFNADGRADIVVSNGRENTVSILFGDSTGFLVESYPGGEMPTALLCDDMNGDGAPDILATSLVGGDFRVLINDNDQSGRFSNVITLPGTIGASGAALGDVDADGDLDLLIASLITSRLSWVKGLPMR
ncbi:MAG: VCBS repeat-containing protein [Planctomycetota bacterium]|nr:VCBS repeat-containing protein [Planctomycetota bacterium]